KQVMLVSNIQLMDRPENFACTSTVWLDKLDFFDSIIGKSLYYSPRFGFSFFGRNKLSMKVDRVFGNREIESIKRPFAARKNISCSVNELVERRPKIVDGVSNDQGDIGRNLLDIPEIVEAILSVVCIVELDRIRINSELVPKFFQVKDVLFGPF